MFLGWVGGEWAEVVVLGVSLDAGRGRSQRAQSGCPCARGHISSPGIRNARFADLCGISANPSRNLCTVASRKEFPPNY